jgi:hypothetical protein
MAVVALIPTGKMKYLALGTALAAVFPGHEFVAWPSEEHMDSFTSCDVTHYARPIPTGLPTKLEELAAELVNAIFPGRRGKKKIDLAYAVEDLELCNRHQADLVLSLFRDAVSAYIRQTWPVQAEAVSAEVRERCSFHLFRPMREAYFFGDPVALERAKVVRPAQLPPNVDLEDFRTIDPEYLTLPPKTQRIAPMPERELHPKHYLQYLCDPTLSDKRKRYKETSNGVAALQSLDWARVVGPAPHCPFLHAFLDELAAALNSPLPFVSQEHAYQRARFPGSNARILRNL